MVVQGENLTERLEGAREAEQRSPAEREPTDWREKEKRRAKDAEGEKPRGTASDPLPLRFRGSV